MVSLPLLQPIQQIVLHIHMSENWSSCIFLRVWWNECKYFCHFENVSYQGFMRVVTMFIFFTSVCSVVGMYQEQLLLNVLLKWPFCGDRILLRSRHILKASVFQTSFFIWTLESSDTNSPNSFIVLFYWCFSKCIPL